MIKSFQTLDLDGDGVISVEELKVGLSEYLDIGTKEALSIAKAIFKKVDTNDSGFIDYS
jgi:Ca2+-binding EF-hand superfamily protein